MNFESPEPYTDQPKPESSGLAVPEYGNMGKYGTAPKGTDLFPNTAGSSDALTGDLLVQKGDAWIPYGDDSEPGEPFGDYVPYEDFEGPIDDYQPEYVDTPDDQPVDVSQPADVPPEPLAIPPDTEAAPVFDGYDGKLSDLDKEPGADETLKIDNLEPPKVKTGGSEWADPPDPPTPRKKPKDPLRNLLSEENTASTGKELELSDDSPAANDPPEAPPDPPEDTGDSPPTEPPNLPVKLPPIPEPVSIPPIKFESVSKYWSPKDVWTGLGRLLLGNFVLGPMGVATQKLEARGVVEESKGIFGQPKSYNVNVMNHSTHRTTKIVVKDAKSAQEAAMKATTEFGYRFAAIKRTI